MSSLDKSITACILSRRLCTEIRSIRRSGQTVTVESAESTKFFVKLNTGKDAQERAEAEYRSLREINSASPGLATTALALGNHDQTHFCVSSFVSMSSLSSEKDQRSLARSVAQLHQHNSTLAKPVTTFGYDIPTFCGSTKMPNESTPDWPTFFAERRISDLARRIAAEQGDDEVLSLAEQVATVAVPLLCSSPRIQPALIHGDLWSGNASLDSETGQPIIFDPCSYYAHSEMELGIMKMFGGFTAAFFDEYHKVIPKLQPYYDERIELYKLYHQMNHWYMFGGGYKSSSMSNMKRLLAFAKSHQT